MPNHVGRNPVKGKKLGKPVNLKERRGKRVTRVKPGKKLREENVIELTPGSYHINPV